MKNISLLLTVLILSMSFLLCSCNDAAVVGVAENDCETDTVSEKIAEETYPETKDTDGGDDAEEAVNLPENENGFKVDFVREELEIFDESQKILLLTGQFIYPVVSMPENPEAEASINAYFASEKEKYDLEAERMHASSLELLGNFHSDYWNTFIYDKKYSLEFVGPDLLSFLCHTEIYLGGAHPTPDESGLVFDLSDGSLIALDELLSDIEGFRAYALPIIKAEVEKESPFEDYENFLPDLIDDGTYFLGKDGIRFICNVYVLFPYAEGIKYYTIPYADAADFINYPITESMNYSKFYSFDIDGEDGDGVLGFFDTREFSCPYDESDVCIINGEERHSGYIVPKYAGSDIVIEHVLYDEDGNEKGSEIYKTFKNTGEDFCLKITCPMPEKSAYYRVVVSFGGKNASFDLIYSFDGDKPVKLMGGN